MSSFDEYKSAFERDGFAVVRRFLSEDELGELEAELERYICDVVPGLEDSQAFYDDRSRPETLKQLQHMSSDDYFRRSVDHPKWNALATALLGERVSCDSPEWFNKPPRTNHPTPAHQDNYYFKYEPPNVLTIWLALDPIDEENGCLRYVAGSHRRGARPHGVSNVLGFSQGLTDYGAADEAAEVPMKLSPGDAIVHHGWTIHRADPNRSSVRHRRAFAMVFRGASCRIDAAARERYQAELNAQHRSMGLESTSRRESSET